jgi:hypothetical protein
MYQHQELEAGTHKCIGRRNGNTTSFSNFSVTTQKIPCNIRFDNHQFSVKMSIEHFQHHCKVHYFGVVELTELTQSKNRDLAVVRIHRKHYRQVILVDDVLGLTDGGVDVRSEVAQEYFFEPTALRRMYVNIVRKAVLVLERNSCLFEYSSFVLLVLVFLVAFRSVFVLDDNVFQLVTNVREATINIHKLHLHL